MRCALKHTELTKKTLTQHTQFITLSFFIMSKSVMLSLLAQGNTGDEILSILDTLTADNVADDADSMGTLNTIEF